MSQTAWCAPDDVAARVTGVGASVPTGMDVQAEIDAAVEMLENRTGFRPFLGETVPSTVTYDLPEDGEVVSFRGGYITAPTISRSGVALTEGLDYDLEPANALIDNRPYRRLRLRSHVRHRMGIASPLRALSVVGPRGFSATIPQAVWNAVRDQATSVVVTAFLSTGGVIEEIKQGPVDIKYATSNKGEDIVTRLQSPMEKLLESGAYSRGRM